MGGHGPPPPSFATPLGHLNSDDGMALYT